MIKNIPLPISLRSFESAARHLSFTLAADELNVSQAAISHQVKALEEYLQTTLFTRLTRKILLTDHGQHLYLTLNESFSKVINVIDEIKHDTGGGFISVSLTSYFSAKWLTLRLSRFWARYPNIDLRLHHSPQPENLDQLGVDIGISWGREKWKNLDSKPLLTSKVVPVCSPKLITKVKPLNTVDELYQHSLLHENDFSLWSAWLKYAGVENVNLNRGTTMDDPNVILQAALAGQGVALGAEMLLRDELETGRLIMPFDSSVSTQMTYHILNRPNALKDEKVNAFYQWLLEETES